MTQAMTTLTSEASSPASAASEAMQLVTFALGSQRYGMDIMSVREIRISNAITALPGAPSYVRGVINLRGTIVPICDLKRRFGLDTEGSEPGAAIVIASIAGKLVGLLVDEVCDILAFPRNRIAPVPEAGDARQNHFFMGLVTDGDELLIVLAPDRLMAAAPEGAEATAAA